MIRCCAIADLHGHLPPDIAPCDLLLIAGDIGFESVGRMNKFAPALAAWLDRQPAKEIVATWGNHDYVAEFWPKLIPKFRWHMLVDQTIKLFGLTIHASPWTVPFCDWSFMLDEDRLAQRWRMIPDKCDILVSHGPPYGFGDLAPSQFDRKQLVHCGSRTLTARLQHPSMDPPPSHVVCGHIHESNGRYYMNKWSTTVINASLMDGNYNMVNKPHYFWVPVPT